MKVKSDPDTFSDSAADREAAARPRTPAPSAGAVPAGRAHTHPGRGADGAPGPGVSQTGRQTAADQGRRHVSSLWRNVAHAP